MSRETFGNGLKSDVSVSHRIPGSPPRPIPQVKPRPKFEHCICDSDEAAPASADCAYHGTSRRARIRQALAKVREVQRELEVLLDEGIG